MEQTISEQLRSVVQRYGERIALTGPNYAPLSYAGLFEQVAHVVDALNDLGVGRGDRVAVVMADGPKMAITGFTSGSRLRRIALGPHTAGPYEGVRSLGLPDKGTVDRGQQER